MIILVKILVTCFIIAIISGFSFGLSNQSPTVFNKILAGLFLYSGVGVIITMLLIVWFF